MFQNGTLINQTDYTSGALYSAGPGGQPVLQYLASSAGRVVKNTDGYSYQYFLTDHLGNIRVVFADDNNDGVAEIVQDNHFYPFGMTMSYLGGLTLGGLDNPFKYQAKEYQGEAFDIGGDTAKTTHLALYDFHARQYDPQLGRWHATDPLMQHVSPYLAMGNNPVSMVDPTGMGDGWWKRFWAWFTGGKTENNGINYGGPKPPKTFGNTNDMNGDVAGGGILAADNVLSFPNGGGASGSASATPYVDPNPGGYDLAPVRGIPEYSKAPYKITRAENGFVRNATGQGGPGWEPFVGTAASVASEMYYSKKYGTWMGKNFKMYKQTWGGNRFTGGKNKFGKTTSNAIKWGGRALGAWNSFSIQQKYAAGEMGTNWMMAEQGTNVVSTFGGIYGAAWGVGWELGRAITTLDVYQEFKFIFWYNRMEKVIGPPSILNEGTWYDFFNNYGR